MQQKDYSFDSALLLGTPRSGSTLLRRLLDAHPEISSPPELNLISSCARMLREDEVARGLPVGLLTAFRCAGLDDTIILGRLRTMITDIFSDICLRDGKRIWVDKDVFTGFYVPEARLILGERTRYIWLYRHGLDVAVSLEEMFQRQGTFAHEFHSYIAQSRLVLEACVHIWLDINGQVQELYQNEPSRVLPVKYEDLVRDPASTMSSIYEFLECESTIDYSVDALSNTTNIGKGDWKTYRQSSVHQDSVGRWHELSNSSLHRLAPLVNPMLESLGYDQVIVPLPETTRNERDEIRRLYLDLEAR